MKKLFLLLAIAFFAVNCSTDDTAEQVDPTEQSTDVMEENEDQDTSVSYMVGDSGPAGGIVIFDKGEITDGWRYIEVAPEDIELDIQWGCLFSEIEGAKSSDLGDGLANSQAILDYHNALNNYYENPEQCNDNNNGTVAAKQALEFVHGGFDDWHLPSRDEGVLFATALHINGLGGFNEDRLYWTSTEHPQDGSAAAAIGVREDFGPDYWGWSGKTWGEDTASFVRPVRYF